MLTVKLPRSPATAPAPTPDAVACAGCGTTTGSRRSGSGPYVRYHGERFGFAGMLCATCRARERRHEKARAQGLEPGRVGRPPSRDRPSVLPNRTPTERTTRASLTPEQVAENLRAVREARERAHPRAQAHVTPPEVQQQRWAELALAERRLVLRSRRQAQDRPAPSLPTERTRPAHPSS